MSLKTAWQLNIHDNNMNIVDHINNEVPSSIKYYNEEFHEYCGKGSATFNFTVDKYRNGVLNPRVANLTSDAYISFQDDGIDYVFNILDRKETNTTIEFQCVSTNLELLNEKTAAYEATEAHSFLEYVDIMNLFRFTKIELGRCDVRDTKLKLKFESDDDTCLARIIKLVEAFDGELELRTYLNQGGQIDRYVLNVYKSRALSDDREPGLGRVRTDIRLQMGRDVSSVVKKEDKTNLFSAIRVRDKDGNYIKQPKAREIKAADGIHNEIFCTRNATTIYAPLSAKLYPSVNKRDNCDNWIVRDVKTEYTDHNQAWAYAVRMLKTYMYPVTTWEIELNSAIVLQRYDIKIGDVIFLTDEHFVGGLLIRARVIELVRCSTDPTKTKIVLSNVVATRPTNNTRLSAVMEQLIAESQPFKMNVKVTGPTMFREVNDSCELIPTLYKGFNEFTDVDYIYYIDNNVAGSGSRFTVSKANIGTSGRALITVQAIVKGEVVEFQDITFSTVSDGISPILTVIHSTNGDTFKNNVIQTRVTAKLYRNDEEIDTAGEGFKYSWTKTLANGNIDTEWSKKPQARMKSFDITNEDVVNRATFSVSIETK
nr:MAG TPA: tail protein [Caudoviricetes sp.]